MLVRIAAYENAIEAHLARGRLEAEGIPAFVCHEHHVTVNWLQSLALQGIKIYVHPQDGDRAREIIAAHDRGEYALDDTEENISCPRCQNTKLSRHRVSWKSAMLTTNFANIPLFFHWATMRCDTCRHEWDLAVTRTYRLLTIALAGIVAAILSLTLFALISPHCLDGRKYFLIFPLHGWCR